MANRPFATRFDEFFRAVHEHPPFPWQRRLAQFVCETGKWPRTVDLPTGSGKTTCIDIALFHFLASVAEGRSGRAARRIAFVVDRRVIVDEAKLRAEKIAKAIASRSEPILQEAARLLEMAAGSAEIEVFALRGGVPKERNLVRDPRSVSVILSTVDQLGSRLLFRGYGVRDNVRSMHAGLFSFDTLLLLDEAHIAEPFLQTIEGIRREQSRGGVEDLGVKPIWCTQLSATPTRKADFVLDSEDRRDGVLMRRLEAAKPMRLLEVAKRDELTKELVALVTKSLEEYPEDKGEMARIGVVVNRISTARDVQRALAKSLKDRAEVHLLIGQVRELDREALLDSLAPKLRASDQIRSGDKPIVVVATQTIEVGADFDFHSMFTEAASYSAIRQRVGRLNRLGNRGRAGGAILLVKAGMEDDPIYGNTIAATWKFLQSRAKNGSIGLGISEAPIPAEPQALMPPPVPTPILTPSVVSLFSQTSPRPAIEPEVADYLHGFTQQRPDVTVVWRDGLYTDGASGLLPISKGVADAILEALPPLAAEAISLPLSVVRGWLRREGKKVDELGDFEGAPESGETGGSRRSDSDPVVFGLGGDGEVKLIRTSQLRPGMSIVVSTEFGGNVPRAGFDPLTTDLVEDFSLQARGKTRRPTLVLTKPIFATWAKRAGIEKREPLDELRKLLETLEVGELGEGDLPEAIAAWFESHSDTLPNQVKETFFQITNHESGAHGDFEVEAILNEKEAVEGLILRSSKVGRDDLVDDRFGLQRTVDVELGEHLAGVGAYAERFGRNIGLTKRLITALRVAGRTHDLGKADPRFQAMLGGGPDAGGEPILLAKGRRVDRRVVLGARHECYSVALLDKHPEFYEDADERDLVRYLVGTHHGRGRGLHPLGSDSGVRFSAKVNEVAISFTGKPELDSLDSGWPDLFRALERRFGPWGLAYLETILRLADHRRSEDEVEGVRA